MLSDDLIVAELTAGPPLLQVVVDTEEEFDWLQPFDQSQRSTRSLQAQPLAQDLFDPYRLKPVYVVDHPVALAPEAGVLENFFRSGRCLIGAHLHPWVNPPFEEPVNRFNSYPGNLSSALEQRKLESLTSAIAERFGSRPLLYKAGRYGVGPATAEILGSLGYLIDLSVVPHTDFRAEEGPDFRACPDRPYWFGPGLRLLEIPLSRGYWGSGLRFRARIVRALQSPPNKLLGGAYARLRLMQRLTLTPEGVDTASHRRVVRAMLEAGHRVFTLTYHSPSLAPGHTPYVRNDRDLRVFLDRIKRLLAFFFEELGGEPTTPLEIRQMALAARDPIRRAAVYRGPADRSGGSEYW